LEGVQGLRKRVFSVVLAVVIVSTILIAFLLLRPTPNSAPQIRIAGVTLSVELAKTPTEQTKGLSGRSNLPADHGMLFVFDREDYWGFWMIDMNFPLDIIWFNSNRQAVYILHDLPPCTPQGCPVYEPPAKASYVLEVNAGFAQSHNVTLGTPFTFLNS
jgi:uncharacterized membrane protein (UPF0127 family)